jgi:hypothetical protein
MKHLRTYISAIAVLLALTLAGFADDIHTDYDKKANFERYHTYAWHKVKASNSLWEQRIADSVDKDLQAKGWQKVEEGSNPDVMVSAVGATQDKQEYQTFYDNFGPGWGWRGWGRPYEGRTQVIDYQVGTLVVDLYDNNSKQLIWRGTASNTLSSKPEKNEKKLEKAVDKMFDKFPPEHK